MSGLVVRAAQGQGIGQVPALSLAAAIAERHALGEHVASLPGLEVEPVDLASALVIGHLIGEGIDWRIAHAVHLSRPSAEWQAGRVVVSTRPDLYADTDVTPIDPTAV